MEKKTVFALAFFLCLNVASYSQTNKLKITEIKSLDIKSVLCNVDTIVHKSNNQLAVRIYQVSNVSGSANLEGSDEVSKRLLIAVSTIDDAPTQHLYVIDNIIYPGKLRLIKQPNNNYLFEFVFGPQNGRVKRTVTITETAARF